MREEERKLAEKIAPIIRCARKMAGYEQSDLAALLDVTQATISRIETGKLSISSYNWLQLCELAKIDLTTIRDEYIETLSTTNLKNDRRIGKFLLPAKYAMNAGIKVRELLPLIEIYKEQKNWQKEFKLTFKLDSDFLYNLDHQLSINFANDLIMELKNKKLYKKANLNKNFKKLFNTNIYKKLESSLNLNKISRYLNCDFLINESNKKIEIKAKSHVKADLKNYFDYNKWLIESLTNKKYKVKTSENTLTLNA